MSQEEHGGTVESIILDRIRGRQRLLLLDYDGTLVPFASRPELAAPDAPLLALLEQLSARDDTSVHIVSGRDRDTLGAWLGHLPVGLHAEHGYWKRLDMKVGWTPRFDDQSQQLWMSRALEIIASAVVTVPGSFVEQKTAAVAWHYRNSDPALAAVARAILRDSLKVLCASDGLELLDGVFVLELRERRAHKGHVVRELARPEADAPLAIAIGDDVTDEDMFAALPPSGVAIAAGPGASSPTLRLDGPSAVRALLASLCRQPSASSRAPLVLVVEDEWRLRDTLAELLEAAGFAVIAVAGGAEALDRLKSGAPLPSVVLTDLTMPGMDGRSLITAIREEPSLQQLPCVVMTALPLVTGVPRDVPVVRKPFGAEEIVALLRQRTEAVEKHDPMT